MNTWRKFHALAYQQSSVPVPMIPIIVRSLVLTGGLFKKGGYRSYPNYLSAIKAVHVEANRQWCQLLSHTAVWVFQECLTRYWACSPKLQLRICKTMRDTSSFRATGEKRTVESDTCRVAGVVVPP